MFSSWMWPLKGYPCTSRWPYTHVLTSSICRLTGEESKRKHEHIKLAGKGGGRKGRNTGGFDQNPMCIYKTLSLKVINMGGVQGCPSAFTDRCTCDIHTLIVSTLNFQKMGSWTCLWEKILTTLIGVGRPVLIVGGSTASGSTPYEGDPGLQKESRGRWVQHSFLPVWFWTVDVRGAAPPGSCNCDTLTIADYCLDPWVKPDLPPWSGYRQGSRKWNWDMCDHEHTHVQTTKAKAVWALISALHDHSCCCRSVHGISNLS